MRSGVSKLFMVVLFAHLCIDIYGLGESNKSDDARVCKLWSLHPLRVSLVLLVTTASRVQRLTSFCALVGALEYHQVCRGTLGLVSATRHCIVF